MIYSFRPLPLKKGCRWMTYHLTVRTIIMHYMKKKTYKRMAMYSSPQREGGERGGGREREEGERER